MNYHLEKNKIKKNIENKNIEIYQKQIKELENEYIEKERRISEKYKEKENKIKNDIDNKLLPKNDILHLGKSNIYILNKEKDNDLLISLDDKNENIEIDNKITNVIQATNKLAQIFQKASMNYKQP